MNNRQTIKVQDLADLLGLTRRQCLDLTKENPPVLRKNNDGNYLLFPSVKGYVAWKKRGGGDPRERLAEAKARIAEAEAELIEGEQIRVDIAVALFADMVANARTKLLTLESNVPPEARKATHTAVHEALTDLSQYDQSELIARLCGSRGGNVGASAKPNGK